MLRAFLHIATILGQLLSLPIYIAHDAMGVDRESVRSSIPRAFSFHSHVFTVGEANFKDLLDQTIGCTQYDAELFCTLPLTRHSGILLSVGGGFTRMRWHTSTAPLIPSLGYQAFEDRSYYAHSTLALGAYTLALQHWQWSALFSCIIDPEHVSREYGVLRGYLSGKYLISEEMSIVFGMIGEMGLHEDKVWPIIGATYKPSPKLTLTFIYPLQFSVNWECTAVCDLGAAYRITRIRKRLHKNPYECSKGIFEYNNRALEGNVRWYLLPGLSLQLFGGISTGSDISLSNRKNQNVNFYPFRSSCFFGTQASYSF